MDFDLGDGWSLTSAGGSTGSAFIGHKAEQTVFLKRNASPFLAALSIEGITPKLIWTRRISTGDVFTAQEFLVGKTLRRSQMMAAPVAAMIGRVHRSKLLKRMLEQVGGSIFRPVAAVHALQKQAQQIGSQDPLLATTFAFLMRLVPETTTVVVCHGDLNHKNWFVSDHRIYLVDWEQTVLADPAYDLGDILGHYSHPNEWGTFLSEYGVDDNAALRARIQWFAAYHLALDLVAPNQGSEAISQDLTTRLETVLKMEN